MMNYRGDFSQSETEKYFELITFNYVYTVDLMVYLIGNAVDPWYI